MNEKMNDIIFEFKKIRKRKLELKWYEIIVLLLFGLSFVTVIVSLLIDVKLKNELLQQFAVFGFFVFVISAVMIFICANNEKPPKFIRCDLRKIDHMLHCINIKSYEDRNKLRTVIKDSMKPRKIRLIHIKSAISVLLIPPLKSIVEDVFGEGKIVSLEGGGLRPGPYLGEYIYFLLIILLIILAATFAKIVIDKDNSMKNDLLTALDEIDLWLTTSEQVEDSE